MRKNRRGVYEDDDDDESLQFDRYFECPHVQTHILECVSSGSGQGVCDRVQGLWDLLQCVAFPQQRL
jgi:hypothetical protein